MKLFFVAIAAVFAFSATAQEADLQCDAMYTEIKASFDSQDASAGNLYECFAKKLDLSGVNDSTTEEEFVNLVVGTCGNEIDAVLTVFEPTALDVILEAGIMYQACKAVEAGN